MTAAVTAGQTLTADRTTTAAHALHGRNKISSKAVRRVVSAVTADALEVKVSDVSVELTDIGGALTVVAKAPIRVSPLGVTGRTSGTLLERLASAQTTIHERVLQLTGSKVERVDLRITSADIRQRRRVA